jgi:transposase-like protein
LRKRLSRLPNLTAAAGGYSYRTIDKSGALVDVRLSESRDKEIAIAFFQFARTANRHHSNLRDDGRARQ